MSKALTFCLAALLLAVGTCVASEVCHPKCKHPYYCKSGDCVCKYKLEHGKECMEPCEHGYYWKSSAKKCMKMPKCKPDYVWCSTKCMKGKTCDGKGGKATLVVAQTTDVSRIANQGGIQNNVGSNFMGEENGNSINTNTLVGGEGGITFGNIDQTVKTVDVKAKDITVTPPGESIIAGGE